MDSAATDVMEFHDSTVDVDVRPEFHFTIPVQPIVHVFRSRVWAG